MIKMGVSFVQLDRYYLKNIQSRELAHYLALSTTTASPFSIRDLSRGAGGTFPTHALIFTPPTVVVHVPHSPC